MTDYPHVFKQVTGENLVPGTLNIEVDGRKETPIKEDFRILGSSIGDPDQDLLFEKCLCDGIEA